MANLTCNSQAVMSLILKSALLSWIEMQLLLGTKERAEWFKILENILVLVDSKKLESVLGSEWRATICRCLLGLLDNKASCMFSFFCSLSSESVDGVVQMRTCHLLFLLS